MKVVLCTCDVVYMLCRWCCVHVHVVLYTHCESGIVYMWCCVCGVVYMLCMWYCVHVIHIVLCICGTMLWVSCGHYIVTCVFVVLYNVYVYCVVLYTECRRMCCVVHSA